MKVITSILISLLSFIATNGQIKNQKLQISHLTGDFYIYTTFNTYKGHLFPANGMYLVTENGVVMFDTPWDSTQFQPLIDSIKMKHNKNVAVCIATHSHEDRTGGLEFLNQQGVKTYTTISTDNISQEKGRKRAVFLMAEDSTFNIGKYSFQTYYAGQGHAPDNIVIWFENEKILYGGCLIKSTEARDLGNIADANLKKWAAAIKKLQNKFKDPKFIIPGHNDWISRDALIHTLRLIRQHKEGK